MGSNCSERKQNKKKKFYKQSNKKASSTDMHKQKKILGSVTKGKEIIYAHTHITKTHTIYTQTHT